MRSSSTFPERRRRHALAATLLALGLTVAATHALHAIDPQRALSQYLRSSWEGSSGYPGGPVYGITQTADGYLWIAAEKGIVRFDGLAFKLIDPTEAVAGTDPVALQLAPAEGSTLWARLRRAVFARYANGHYEAVPRETLWLATAMAPARDGAMLVADSRLGVVLVHRDRIQTVVSLDRLPRSPVISVAQTPTGDVWIGTRDAGLVRVHGGQVVPISEDLPDLKINCLVPDVSGHLWIGTDGGVARWDGQQVTRTGLPAALNRVRITTMIEDRDANLWLGTPEGVLRLNARGLESLERRSDGAAVSALFEDRDGNLWIGTSSGLERWRDGAFTAYPQVRTVTSVDAGPVFVDAADRVWFAPSTGGLFWMRDGRVARVAVAGLDRDIIYSLDGGGSDVWVGRQRGGLTRLRVEGDGYLAETFTQGHGLAQNYVYAVHRGRSGAVWAGTLSAGVSRFKEGVFKTYTSEDGLASNTIAAILEASDGTTWFATPNGATALGVSGWRQYSMADGLPSNDVQTLFEDSARNVWLGTNAGLSVVRAGRVHTGLSLPEALRASILGIGEGPAGRLWIATADHVLRVDREGLLGSATADGLVREYDAADGLLGIEGIKRHRSLSTDARGRIWLSTNGGLAMVDPVRVADRSGPALVHIGDVSADGKSVAGAPLRLPPRPQRITVTFTGLSLSAPERVRFRYRLDGFDRQWSEPSPSRQAVYTNLGPGPYRFRVLASNSDGAWNGAEVVLPFTIAPALWERTWFQGAVALALTATVWAGYRLRVRQVARQLSVRFDERLAERTRIARDLHDTLLQSFHGAIFRFQAGINLLPERPVEARERFEQAIDRAVQAVTEGRDAVQNLRAAASEHSDLAEEISALGAELAAVDIDGARTPATLEVTVIGTPQALRPILRDDVYRITGEALRNAYRHARAHRIEVEIEYDTRHFRVRVRDDGQGIEPALLAAQRAGHFGLSGMRERAELVGGHLDVWTEAGAGAEVDLTIPAAAAYAAPRARGRLRWPRGRTKASA